MEIKIKIKVKIKIKIKIKSKINRRFVLCLRRLFSNRNTEVSLADSLSRLFVTLVPRVFPPRGVKGCLVVCSDWECSVWDTS